MKTVILLSLLSVTLFAQQTMLTNDSVLEMNRAGLPASVIITKIKTSDSSFKTDTPDLKALTDASVPESVISAVIEAAAAKSKAQQTAAAERISSETEKERVEATRLVTSPPFTPFAQLDKASQKQRMKNAPQIAIGAPADQVMSMLVRGFQSWNYQVESESPRSLTMSKSVPGFGNQLLVGMAMGGNNFRYKITATVSETSGISYVIVNAWMTSQNAFGKTNSQSIDGNKKFRAQLDDLLMEIKRRTEHSDN